MNPPKTMFQLSGVHSSQSFSWTLTSATAASAKAKRRLPYYHDKTDDVHDDDDYYYLYCYCCCYFYLRFHVFFYCYYDDNCYCIVQTRLLAERPVVPPTLRLFAVDISSFAVAPQRLALPARLPTVSLINKTKLNSEPKKPNPTKPYIYTPVDADGCACMGFGRLCALNAQPGPSPPIL